MKIAILTFHNSPNNAGAVLQAFALQRTLEKMGHDARLLDYHRERGDIVPWWSFSSLRGVYYTIRRLPLEFCRLRKCDAFRRRALSLIATQYGGRIGHTDADAYIVGSDQVFNPIHNECNPSFLLDFVPLGKKRIAYGVSFGTTRFSNEYRVSMSTHLPHFTAISVREKEGMQIVKEIANRGATLVCDPTLLLNASEYDAFKSNAAECCPYGFVYLIGNSPNARKIAAQIAERMGIERVLVCTNRRAEWHCPRHGIFREKYVYAPDDFLQYISHAAFVVTNSFHGTAFSILYQRPFFTLMNGTAGDSRMQTMLGVFGLARRTIAENAIDDRKLGDIDWQAVSSRLERMRSGSIAFLQSALEDRR